MSQPSHDIIRARPTPLGRWFWQNFSRWGFRLCFREMRLIGPEPIDPKAALLVLGNHISWWDGFWVIELNRRYLRKQYHVMMLEEQLAARRFMTQGGAFSIRPGSRSIVYSLDHAAGLLSEPQNLVSVFPQGRIHSLYDPEFHFFSGLNRIFKQQRGPLQLLFLAHHIDYFATARPGLYVRMHTYTGAREAEAVTEAYRAFYAKAIQAQLGLAEEEG